MSEQTVRTITLLICEMTAAKEKRGLQTSGNDKSLQITNLTPSTLTTATSKSLSQIPSCDKRVETLHKSKLLPSMMSYFAGYVRECKINFHSGVGAFRMVRLKNVNVS